MDEDVFDDDKLTDDGIAAFELPIVSFTILLVLLLLDPIILLLVVFVVRFVVVVVVVDCICFRSGLFFNLKSHGELYTAPTPLESSTHSPSTLSTSFTSSPNLLN